MTEQNKVYRILVSAGDASGDLILAKVIGELKRLKPEIHFEVFGLHGPATEALGTGPSLVQTKDVAVVGIVEVLKKLPRIFSSLKILERALTKADSVLCVDFPDFNLRLAQMAQRKNKPVDYIIAPQVWAWRSGRLPMIKQRIRHLFVALPFEELIFKQAGVECNFLGHPIRDLLPPKNRSAARSVLGLGLEDYCLALLPGSRHGEIKRHLGLYLEALEDFLVLRRRRDLMDGKQFKVVVALAPGLQESDLLAALSGRQRKLWDSYVESSLMSVHSNSREVLMAADLGWICSGTASLEAALYQLPHLLVYKVNSLSVFLLNQMSHYFRNPDAAVGLPNILLRRKVIPELLQKNLSAKRLSRETSELLTDPIRLAQIRKELRFLPKKLGEAGATQRIAETLLKLWNL